MPVRPIFLFSLPRSGSTLLQRLLARHEAISTASEPWLLLPLLQATCPGRLYSQYNHDLAGTALAEFMQQLPQGRGDYLAAVAKLATELYSKASSPGAKFFLDKTPRYHLVAREVIEAFPDAKIILLWRNPLAVVASQLATNRGGRFLPYTIKVDLYQGLENLVHLQQERGDQLHVLRYEDLVRRPEEELSRLWRYLELPELPPDSKALDEIKLSGSLGDQTGVEKYQQVETASLEAWKDGFASPVRKAWARRYLQWIGASRLEQMGYGLEELTAQVKQIPSALSRLPLDCWDVLQGTLLTMINTRDLRDRFQDLKKGEKSYMIR